MDNTYHLDGELVMAPAEVFLHTLKISLPIFCAAAGCPKLLLAPMPRYLMAGCCTDKDHIPNMAEAGYEDVIFSGVDNIRRQCKNFMHMNKVSDCTTINTGQMICSSEGARTTPDNIKEELKAIWGPDPVHASGDCYARLAKNLLSFCNDKAGLSRTEDRKTGLDVASKRPRWIVSGEVEGGIVPTSILNQLLRGGYQRGQRGLGGQRARGFFGRRPRGGRRGW